VSRPDFPEAFTEVPVHRQYCYLHWFNASTDTQAQDFTAEIHRVFPYLQRLGFEFAGTYGEIGVKENAIADRNYKAQAGIDPVSLPLSLEASSVVESGKPAL